MTQLKTSVVLSPSCGLTVTDTTGFYDSVTAPGGFLPETDVSTPVVGTYKISNGYFITLLTYNKYNGIPSLSNTTAIWYKPVTISTTYANNFTSETYNLATDGTYTVNRIFMISDVYYNAHKTGSFFTGKDIYYTDGSSVYLVDGVTSNTVTLSTLANADLSDATVSTLSTTLISTCQLNNCYYLLMDEILNLGVGNCNVSSQLIRDRDFVYMTLETIKYLQDFENYTQIQKLIEGTFSCGLCSARGKVSDCGCNG